MITTVAQRWRDRRGIYVPSSEPIQTSDYEVAPIADDNTPKAFIERHHYSGSFVSARFRFGIYHRSGELRGVAVFSHPCSNHVLRVFPGSELLAGVELGRFVLLDTVASYGETWFLARAFEHLRREGIVGVVSFSDPMPRTNLAGEETFAGHIGNAYQAHNAIFLGRTKSEPLYLFPDGRSIHRRTLSKIKNGESGRRYASKLLERYGADPLGDGDACAWLDRWVPTITRPVKHPGNLRYVWGLNRSMRRSLLKDKRRADYLKFDDTKIKVSRARTAA